MNSTILILTHLNELDGCPLLPHLNWIYKTNPEVDVRVIVGEDSAKGKKYNWKNGDQPLRKWWKINSTTVKNDLIYIIEWDTLITCKLPELPPHLDLVGKQIINENPNIRGKWYIKPMKDPTWTDDNWYWWPDIPKMKLSDDDLAIGLISFGFFITRKWVLDKICDEKWDYIYNESIQNELRFPTIAKLEGARIGEIYLPNVHFGEMVYDDISGIYHPIKHRVG